MVRRSHSTRHRETFDRSRHHVVPRHSVVKSPGPFRRTGTRTRPVFGVSRSHRRPRAHVHPRYYRYGGAFGAHGSGMYSGSTMGHSFGSHYGHSSQPRSFAPSHQSQSQHHGSGFPTQHQHSGFQSQHAHGFSSEHPSGFNGSFHDAPQFRSHQGYGHAGPGGFGYYGGRWGFWSNGGWIWPAAGLLTVAVLAGLGGVWADCAYSSAWLAQAGYPVGSCGGGQVMDTYPDDQSGYGGDYYGPNTGGVAMKHRYGGSGYAKQYPRRDSRSDRGGPQSRPTHDSRPRPVPPRPDRGSHRRPGPGYGSGQYHRRLRNRFSRSGFARFYGAKGPGGFIYSVRRNQWGVWRPARYSGQIWLPGGYVWLPPLSQLTINDLVVLGDVWGDRTYAAQWLRSVPYISRGITGGAEIASESHSFSKDRRDRQGGMDSRPLFRGEWKADVPYHAGDQVVVLGIRYESLVPDNIGFPPTTSGLVWARARILVAGAGADATRRSDERTTNVGAGGRRMLRAVSIPTRRSDRVGGGGGGRPKDTHGRGNRGTILDRHSIGHVEQSYSISSRSAGAVDDMDDDSVEYGPPVDMSRVSGGGENSYSQSVASHHRGRRSHGRTHRRPAVHPHRRPLADSHRHHHTRTHVERRRQSHRNW